MAVLRAEGVKTPGPFHLNNTAAFVHRIDTRGVGTAATNSAKVVRIQIITPPGALGRDGQKQITKEATDIVAKVSGDPTQAGRTWVILTEAAEGGWGIAGTAFGKQGVRRPRRKDRGRARPVGPSPAAPGSGTRTRFRIGMRTQRLTFGGSGFKQSFKRPTAFAELHLLRTRLNITGAMKTRFLRAGPTFLGY